MRLRLGDAGGAADRRSALGLGAELGVTRFSSYGLILAARIASPPATGPSPSGSTAQPTPCLRKWAAPSSAPTTER